MKGAVRSHPAAVPVACGVAVNHAMVPELRHAVLTSGALRLLGEAVSALFWRDIFLKKPRRPFPISRTHPRL